MMVIKILNQDDNIEQYLSCVGDLMKSGGDKTTVEDIKYSLSTRPSNIITFVGFNDAGDIISTATVIMEKKLRYKQLCCHIEDVGVSPCCRGQGYGRQIVEYCVNVAKSNRCYKIKLNCDDSLVSFYSKIGFIKLGNHMIMG